MYSITLGATLLVFRSVSRHSCSGSERKVIAPPAPTEISTHPVNTYFVTRWSYTIPKPLAFLLATAVRITTLKSALPSKEKYPRHPEYTPRGLCCSKSSNICTDRSLGAPVIEPGGKHLRTASTLDTAGCSLARTVDTKWCSFSYVSTCINFGTLTLLGSHTWAKSFRIKSTIW